MQPWPLGRHKSNKSNKPCKHHAIKIKLIPNVTFYQNIVSCILQHEVLQSHSPSHLFSRTQGLRSSHDPNTNSTQGVNYHISKKIQINKDMIKINYRSIYNIVQLNTIHITSPPYHLKFTFQSSITLHMNHTLRSRCNKASI